jgi:hypothetical protein
MGLRKKVADAVDVLRGVKQVSLNSDDAPSSSIGSSDQGASFGQSIDDSERLFAVQREPIAYRVVYMVAHDVFDKWFKVVDTAENPDDGLDAKVQDILNSLDAKRVFTEAAAFERMYGWSIIALGFRDGFELGEESRQNMRLEELAVYDPTDVANLEEDTDINSDRFGLPQRYLMQRGSAQTWIHYTRTIHVATRLLDHRYRGMSALDPIWDDLTCLRNIRWGLAQTIFRYGSGFPDITLQGATKAQIDDFTASGVFKNVHARTYFVHNEKQSMDFKGVQGSALNPQLYYEPILENISAGCGIPKAILRGAQAGALTGSEVNTAEYFKFISDQQSLYEPAVRQLIDALIASKQVKTGASDYRIEWVSGFEHSDREEAEIEMLREQAQRVRSSYMTINEIRSLADPPLQPLPETIGNTILGASSIQGTPGAQLGGNPLADEVKASSHAVMLTAIKGIVNRCITGETNRKQALEEASRLIADHISAERGRAQAYIRARTGVQTAGTTPEMEAEFYRIQEEYLSDFERILDDALKAGGLVE